jgi:hypothetical protein
VTIITLLSERTPAKHGGVLNSGVTMGRRTVDNEFTMRFFCDWIGLGVDTFFGDLSGGLEHWYPHQDTNLL